MSNDKKGKVEPVIYVNLAILGRSCHTMHDILPKICGQREGHEHYERVKIPRHPSEQEYFP